MGTVEVATTRRARARGLLGRPAPDGALLLPRTRSVHGVGMTYPIDVARLDAAGVVVRVDRLAPGGLLLPCRGAHHVLEAAAGAFASWGLGPASQLEVAPAASVRTGRRPPRPRRR
ncbi:MAG: DUF192 domain-containing protein [Acidimicrobiales bacterium]|nr:DUF192 domain-containing protein [Acidimicrobiales bacterium]HRW37765.1 DUF192 domain-containing protein [Aquihabitans sp.]